ncbi:MAG: tRNA (adenosine(37)-N6)-threonylcarbamoyltransferase complex dimerization subunit type 1 TsaB [Pseudomonadota bacterium]
MKLAIDTAGPVCSVALCHADRVYTRRSHEPRAHARHVLGLVDAVCRAANAQLAQVDTLLFGEGPGGLTGVRVAASVVQGFALALGARVVAVNNLDALATRIAHGLAPRTQLVLIQDAGAGSVCVRPYMVNDARAPNPTAQLEVTEPDAVALPGGPLVVAGGASDRVSLPSAAGWFEGRPTWAEARDLLSALDGGLARYVAPELAQPLYVRHPVDATITL